VERPMTVKELLNTTDPAVWVEEFFRANRSNVLTKSVMREWFAYAIETGRTKALDETQGREEVAYVEGRRSCQANFRRMAEALLDAINRDVLAREME
jgi:hypothetical protein